ncbi:2-dehydropantoate 2-reductase [Paraglaciecola sp.]|uniref:2-dehydropantoate 2-reductase n=1 Tax=Paraglaciecola sp. TaxID=1920173 RepID=UPI003EF48A0D
MSIDKNKKHVVFGAGLIGCYIGGVLTSLGINTTLICRAQVKTKLKDGLVLTDYLENQIPVSKVNVCTFEETKIENLSKPSQIEYLWLTVKCTGLTSALLDMKELITDNTIILCCQNGLGSKSQVQKAFPNNSVLRVMVPFNVVELKRGHYHKGSEGQLTIEQIAASNPTSTKLVDSINCDLMPTCVTDNITALLWAKLQLNLSNAVCALADTPVKAMLEQANYRNVIAVLMQELLAVTKASGIDLPKLTPIPANFLPILLKLPNWLFKRLANKMLAIDPNVKTSMWWDISQGKPTEIDYLNGALVKQGNAHGLSCPANQKIVKLIKSLELNNGKNKASPISSEALYKLVTTK